MGLLPQLTASDSRPRCRWPPNSSHLPRSHRIGIPLCHRRHNWYDLAVTGRDFEQRVADRVETGHLTYTDLRSRNPLGSVHSALTQDLSVSHPGVIPSGGGLRALRLTDALP